MRIRQASIDDVGTLVRLINDAFQVERFFIDRDRTVHYVHRDEVAKRVRAAEIVRTLGPAAEGSRFATRFASRG